MKKCSIAFLVLLVVLLVVVAFDKPLRVDAKSLQVVKENQKVGVEGRVVSVKIFEALTLVSIKDGVGVMNLVIFDAMVLRKGDRIRAVGRVSVYKDKKELVVESLEVW